jgi:hypothetical protein
MSQHEYEEKMPPDNNKPREQMLSDDNSQSGSTATPVNMEGVDHGGGNDNNGDDGGEKKDEKKEASFKDFLVSLLFCLLVVYSHHLHFVSVHL